MIALAGSVTESDPAERFEAIWTKVIESFAAHRPLWAATFEVIGQVDHVPQLREQLVAKLAAAREGLAYPFEDRGPTPDDPTAWAIDSVHQAVITGIMAQLLIDPDSAMSARDLAIAFRAIGASITTGSAPDPVPRR